MDDTSAIQVETGRWRKISEGVYERALSQQTNASVTLVQRLVRIKVPTYYFIDTAGATRTA